MQHSVNSSLCALRRAGVLKSRHQRGVVLVVSLVLLFAMTMLGVSVLRDSGIEAKVVGNSIDHARAREAAEITARLAEEWIEVEVQQGKLPHAANFFPKNGTLAIQGGGSAASARVVIRDEVFDAANAEHWKANGRDAEQKLSGVTSSMRYVVASMGIDASEEVNNLNDDHNQPSANPTQDSSLNEKATAFRGYSRDRNLGLGTVSDHAGRMILKVYARVEGPKTGSPVVVETTYAYPYNP